MGAGDSVFTRDDALQVYVFGGPRPTFPASRGPLPGAPGLSRWPDGPGLRGLNAQEVSEGISTAEFTALLALYAHDQAFDVAVQHHVVIDGSAARRHAAWRALRSKMFGSRPLPGFAVEELTAHGWSPDPGAAGFLAWSEQVSAAYEGVLAEDPTRLDLIADILEFPSQLPPHHVAWCSMDGVVEYDLLGLGREGSAWTCYGLVCDCSANYEIRDGGGVTTFSDRDGFACLYRAVAAHDQALATRDRLGWAPGVLPDPAAVRDVLGMALHGEWVGQPHGSEFWGSNLYLQTVAAIAGVSESGMWDVAAEGQARGLFSMEGSVLIPFRGPAEDPSALLRSVDVGSGVRLDVYGPVGVRESDEIVIKRVTGDSVAEVSRFALGHTPVFGYDVEDLDRVNEELARLSAES